MKLTTSLNLLALGLVLAFAVGCKKSPSTITHIPRLGGEVGGDDIKGDILTPREDTQGQELTGGGPLADRSNIESRPKDREMLRPYTVYFEFDRFNVRSSEQSKLEAVASHLRANPAHDVLIEGHCDERGTEGYNLTLGDRRALALREHLVNLGAPANRIHTISFGESRPAVSEANEAAYAKNRRGEFIVVLP